MKTKKIVIKKNRLCSKCGNLQRCHYCGRGCDNRGWAKVWKFIKNGPEHCICPSCAE